MNANSSATASLELSLVEIEPRGEESPVASRAAPTTAERTESELRAPTRAAPIAVERHENAPRAPDNDRFLAVATREYRDGHIDQPLWVHAVDRTGGNETAALQTYLQARATALRLARREKRAGASARRNRVLHERDQAAGDAEDRVRAGSGTARGGERLGAIPMWQHLSITAAMIVAGVALAWWIVAPRGNESAQPFVASASAPGGDQSGPAPAIGSGQPNARNAVVKASAEEQARELEAKVQQLLNAGNWNVSILHASEWTRKEPVNPNAWKQLSIGYAKLRQFNDAIDAAEKSVALAPTDSSMWRNLGQVNLAAKEHIAALKAFDRATELNEQDAESLVLAGTSNAQLGRLPQARLAFDRALAVNPGNTDALCGQALVAQKQGKPKEAEAIAKQLTAADKVCSDPGDAGSVAVAVSTATAYKAVPVRAR